MTDVVFDPHRFRTAARYYTRYRIPYPPELLADIATRFALEPGERVLDLGCGPAMLGIAFAGMGLAVTAIDPEPEMLAIAGADATAAGVDVRFLQGSSYDLGPHLGTFRLVVMGRSFHWMDRATTLVALDRLVEPGGGLALLADRRLASSHDWVQEVEQIADRYLPEGAPRFVRRAPGFAPHEAFLVDSAFSHVESIGRAFARQLTLDDILGRTYSMSVTSPDVFGDRLEAFDAALRARLVELAPDGRFSEVVSVDAVLATRPAPAAG